MISPRRNAGGCTALTQIISVWLVLIYIHLITLRVAVDNIYVCLCDYVDRSGNFLQRFWTILWTNIECQ